MSDCWITPKLGMLRVMHMLIESHHDFHETQVLINLFQPKHRLDLKLEAALSEWELSIDDGSVEIDEDSEFQLGWGR